ncbi:MAG: Hsp33 family molecular chaperone HslO [Gammaproteobacteria bacterium]|nr:Hsp33 family molecular chaperone HslO [Gammaproteobacteria bacterium]
MSDTLQRFLFENANIRGELVQLDASWQAALAHHDYPQSVREPLGEMLVAAVLLTATMKFEGNISLQVRGNGPITMLVVDCTPRRVEGEEGALYHIRGMALWQGEVPEGDLRSRFGDGSLVITIYPGTGGQRYQGVVALSGHSLADAIDDYLERSEQLPTRMWLRCSGERAAGMLLQKLPASGGEEDADGWERVNALAATVRDEELLQLGQGELIHRLFHEEDLRLFAPEPVAFHCHCSRQRVADSLRGLGRDEVMGILKKEQKIEVSCHFCNRHYRFDAVDAAQLFIEPPPPPARGVPH